MPGNLRTSSASRPAFGPTSGYAISTSGAPADASISASAIVAHLCLRDAGVEQHAGDLARLVRLDVRPEALRPAGHFDHARDVGPDQFRVEDKRRAEQTGWIGKTIAGLHG